jgi:sulfatase maturation enzyme AslB (radical SAM superfamily)
VDWQINLGNHCNSGCVFCGPDYSSRLTQEFKKLKIAHNEPLPNWCADPQLIDQFVNSLSQTQLAYLHFIGGETVITPAFKIILEKLVSAGINRRTSIGFTTNLTVWDSAIVDLLTQFDQVHLGMSIECLHPVNDYVRWPSQINSVQSVLDQWIQVGRQHHWYMSLRTTPTALTVAHLIDLYEFADQQHIGIESCNFLHNPKFLRMSVLPMEHRLTIADQMQSWIDQQQVSAQTQTINIRDPSQLHIQRVQDAASYVDYLRTAPDETALLPDLVKYLKLLESSRSNSILDYAPEYEHILRSAGY